MVSRRGRCSECREVFDRDELEDVNGLLYCEDDRPPSPIDTLDEVDNAE